MPPSEIATTLTKKQDTCLPHSKKSSSYGEAEIRRYCFLAETVVLSSVWVVMHLLISLLVNRILGHFYLPSF